MIESANFYESCIWSRMYVGFLPYSDIQEQGIEVSGCKF